MAEKQKNQVIDSNKEVRKNIFIELELDEELEEMINNKNILSDGKDIINAGFSTLQITYITNPQIMHKSSVKLRSQGLKRLIEESIVLN